jgi:hypothetical protein
MENTHHRKRSQSTAIGDIACLNTHQIPAMLISTTGFHCKVWQSTMLLIHEWGTKTIDYVIKKYNDPCPLKEVEILNRDYREIKARLGEIIPTALFVATRVDGMEGVIAIAETVYPWFNIANPANEEEAIPLLGKLPKAQDQLELFLTAAREWHRQNNAKVIDLYGLDNLILDRNSRIKYIDSFSVFFYEDLLYLCNEIDEELQERINISLKRRDYLEYLLHQSRRA